MHFQRFGGDNRDQGKGFVFHHLASQLRDFRVDPMITDDNLPPGPQRQAYIEAYRRFLRLGDGHQIANSDAVYRGGVPVIRDGRRESYFATHVGAEYDLFLDPDTGIGEGGREYVPYDVISELLPSESARVLLVYVSSNRNDASWKWLLSRVPNWADGRLQAFVCDMGGNGILFLSNSGNDRLKFMRGTLKNVFGPVAEWRIRS